jgi:hypothetical protein
MSECTQIPSWISYLQALAVPVIAFAGVLVAFQQARLAQNNLIHDAFYRRYEKRLALFQATREFLASTFHPGISEEDIRAYGLRALDAKFLFDEPLYQYLHEIRQHVSAWHEADSRAKSETSPDTRAEYERIKTTNMSWIIAQGDESFPNRFVPFLMPEEIKRPWWAR